MRVVVLMGGRSHEREISLKSGQAVLSALKRLGHEAVALDLEEDLCERLKSIKPDKVFIALHGTYGEDGRVQGLLDLLGIPYVGSGVLGSALAMDKDMTKRILLSYGIPTPRWVCVREEEEVRWDTYPAVVKPADQGSSIGLHVVKNRKELQEALKDVLKISGKVIVEEFIKGLEVTVGVLKGRALPPLEIRPKKGVYDYESKYTRGMSEYVFLEDENMVGELQRIALEVFKVMELKDMARVDFRVSKEGKLYVLEVNTLPGMTELSLFPMACKRMGIDFDQMISILLS